MARAKKRARRGIQDDISDDPDDELGEDIDESPTGADAPGKPAAMPSPRKTLSRKWSELSTPPRSSEAATGQATPNLALAVVTVQATPNEPAVVDGEATPNFALVEDVASPVDSQEDCLPGVYASHSIEVSETLSDTGFADCMRAEPSHLITESRLLEIGMLEEPPNLKWKRGTLFEEALKSGVFDRPVTADETGAGPVASSSADDGATSGAMRAPRPLPQNNVPSVVAWPELRSCKF